MSEGTSEVKGRGPARRLCIHLCLLGVLLVALLATSELRSGFTVDEGSYAIQAHAVRDGSWAIHWPFRDVDATGTYFPYHAGRLSDSEEFAYIGHPAWPAALAATSDVFGEDVGLRLLSLLSVLIAAACGFLLAARLGGAVAAPWGFWLVAASPVLVNGLMIWAHATAAAAAGVAALAAAALIDRERRWWPWLALPLGLAAGMVVRSESAFVGVAIIGVLGGLGVRAARRDLQVAAAGAAVACAAAYVLERAWIVHIAGDDGTIGLGSRTDSDLGWFVGRIVGAIVSLFLGGTSAVGAIIGLLTLWLVVVAVMATKRPEMRMRPTPLLWVAFLLTLVRILVADDDAARGLLAAWPVAVLAPLAVRSDATVHRALGAIVVIAVGGVLLTQWDDGGGLQWGGRYLAIVIVPIAALAAAALVGPRLANVDRRAVAALVAVGAVLAVVVTDNGRRANVDGMQTIDETGAQVVLSETDQFARLDWRRWPGRCWLAANDDLPGSLRLLARTGTGQIAYVGFPVRDLRDASAAPREIDHDDEIGTIGARGSRRACPTPAGG